MLPLACLLRMSDLGQLGPIRAKKKKIKVISLIVVTK